MSSSSTFDVQIDAKPQKPTLWLGISEATPTDPTEL